MNFTQAIASGFKKYVNFTGRAARSEYLVSGRSSLFSCGRGGDRSIWRDRDAAVSPLKSLVSLALLLPGLAVSARRLHDLDRTGWWLLLVLTGIGVILLIIWDCIEGTTVPTGSVPTRWRVPCP